MLMHRISKLQYNTACDASDLMLEKHFRLFNCSNKQQLVSQLWHAFSYNYRKWCFAFTWHELWVWRTQRWAAIWLPAGLYSASRTGSSQEPQLFYMETKQGPSGLKTFTEWLIPSFKHSHVGFMEGKNYMNQTAASGTHLENTIPPCSNSQDKLWFSALIQL